MPTSAEHVARQLRAILSVLPDTGEKFRDACRQVNDWDALLATAHAHGVSGVVLAGTERGRVAVPSRAKNAAAQRLKLVAVWRDVLQDNLRAIVAALAGSGITAVTLKGPLLAMQLYEDDALRPSTDLDILVAPASLDAAARALRPLGYVLEGGPTGRFFRDHHHHVHALHPILPAIELHFDAYRGFGTALPAPPLLARSIPCPIQGWSEARVLAPEDEFLYLAVHAASHRFQRLVWLFDLKLLALRYPDLRWNHVAARAQAHRLSAVVSFTCALLCDWLGTPRYGAPYFRGVGEARTLAAECLTRRRSTHAVSAAAGFLFSALLCDDIARAVAFSARFARIKAFHEGPLRAQGFRSG